VEGGGGGLPFSYQHLFITRNTKSLLHTVTFVLFLLLRFPLVTEQCLLLNATAICTS